MLADRSRTCMLCTLCQRLHSRTYRGRLRQCVHSSLRSLHSTGTWGPKATVPCYHLCSAMLGLLCITDISSVDGSSALAGRAKITDSARSLILNSSIVVATSERGGAGTGSGEDRTLRWRSVPVTTVHGQCQESVEDGGKGQSGGFGNLHRPTQKPQSSKMISKI